MILIRNVSSAKPAIAAVYRRTAAGFQSIAFAVDLIKRTGGDTLAVLIPSDPESGVLPGHQPGSLLARQSAQIIEDVRRLSGIENVVVSPADVAGGIVIDCGDAVECEEVDTLYPRQETSLLSRGQGPVLIPFGDSIEAITAAERGFAIARALALPAVLYHTTWRDDSQSSTAPEVHMCSDAREVGRKLTELAQSLSVPVKSVIEIADDVVEGIVRCAMRESARLLVMSRSSKTTVGCYVDQALIQSPVPLLAIAALDRRRA